MKVLIYVAFFYTSSLFAHAGKHDTVKLPAYEENKVKGQASLRITEVNNQYIVAFSSPQYNFIENDKHDISGEDQKKVDEVLKKLKNPAYIFSTKVFKCSLSNPSHVMRAKKLRTLDPKMGLKKVDIKKKAQFSEYFANIAAQYKLKCKLPIKEKELKLRIFKLSPKLTKLSIEIDTKAEKKTVNIDRPAEKKPPMKHKPTKKDTKTTKPIEQNTPSKKT